MKVGDKVYNVNREMGRLGSATVCELAPLGWGTLVELRLDTDSLDAFGVNLFGSTTITRRIADCSTSPLAAAQRYLNECADELTAARQKHTAAIEFVAEVAKGTP